MLNHETGKRPVIPYGLDYFSAGGHRRMQW